MSEKEVLVPNIGDFKDVEVIEVLIEAGSNINKDDPIITIESDKSSVEIPSPYSGSVKKVNLKVGDKVSEGSSILIIGSQEEKPDEQIEEEVKEIKEEKLKNSIDVVAKKAQGTKCPVCWKIFESSCERPNCGLLNTNGK